MLPPNATLVSLMKGVELGTAKRMSEVIAEVAGRTGRAHRGGLRAEPRARDRPGATTATVVACADLARATAVRPRVRSRRTSARTRTPTSSAASSAARSRTSSRWPCGMAQGMGFGDNTVASLITRGLAETARLGAVLGADPMTFAGLAGLGDLVATCSSPLSRNRTFGERLGRGETLEQAQQATSRSGG